jgi:hypothetical protein
LVVHIILYYHIIIAFVSGPLVLRGHGAHEQQHHCGGTAVGTHLSLCSAELQLVRVMRKMAEMKMKS